VSAPTSVDVDRLPLTQYLVLEVLAARHRLGEHGWTFPATARPAVDALTRLGLVAGKAGFLPKTLLVWLTDAGRAAVLSADYVPPVEREEPAIVAAFIQARLNEDERKYTDHIVPISEITDSVRAPGWYAAACIVAGCEWVTEGRLSVVEEVAYEHVVAAHADLPMLRRIAALRNIATLHLDTPLPGVEEAGEVAAYTKVMWSIASIWPPCGRPVRDGAS
jgi:hypothetical protein